jgi:TetR/AcrR family transcriptional regulator, cholesterol catabolism regulator
MSTRVEQNRAAKTGAILDASARLFAQNGYHPTRLADVANELGLHKASLYHYFDSKESILVELIQRRVGKAVAALELIAEGGQSDPKKLGQAVRSHIEIFHENADLYTIFQSERLHTISDKAAELVNERGRRYEQIFADLIEAGIESGEFRQDLDPRITMKAIVGLCNSTLSWFRASGRVSLVELADRYVEMALRIVTSASPPAASTEAD